MRLVKNLWQFFTHGKCSINLVVLSMMLLLLSISIVPAFTEGNGKLGFPCAEISPLKFTESFYSTSGALTCVVMVVGTAGGVIQKRFSRRLRPAES